MVNTEINLNEINRIILELKKGAERLKELSGGLQCIDRNCDRLLAGITMLELNITDAREFLE